MIKVRSRAVKYVDWNAYCSEDPCNWSSHGMNSKNQARIHSQKTGHRVEVFGEKFFVVKPVEEEEK